jgi:hypothetical protein
MSTTTSPTEPRLLLDVGGGLTPRSALHLAVPASSRLLCEGQKQRCHQRCAEGCSPRTSDGAWGNPNRETTSGRIGAPTHDV